MFGENVPVAKTESGGFWLKLLDCDLVARLKAVIGLGSRILVFGFWILE